MGRGQDSMVNVRMCDDLIDKVDQAAETAHLRRSAWCREVLTAAVESGMPLHRITELLTSPPEPTVAVSVGAGSADQLGARRLLTGRCLHPPHARLRYPTQDVCAACDTVLARR